MFFFSPRHPLASYAASAATQPRATCANTPTTASRRGASVVPGQAVWRGVVAAHVRFEGLFVFVLFCFFSLRWPCCAPSSPSSNSRTGASVGHLPLSRGEGRCALWLLLLCVCVVFARVYGSWTSGRSSKLVGAVSRLIRSPWSDEGLCCFDSCCGGVLCVCVCVVCVCCVVSDVRCFAYLLCARRISPAVVVSLVALV